MKMLIRDSFPSPARCACNDGFDMTSAPVWDTNKYYVTVEGKETNPMLYKAAFTSEREQNANAACENDANVRCRQTAFGCVMNVRRTAECYPPNVGTSKEIRKRC